MVGLLNKGKGQHRILVDALHKGLKENLIAMVLFGSRARREATESSDWDIFLIAQDLPQSPLQRQITVRKFIPQD